MYYREARGQLTGSSAHKHCLCFLPSDELRQAIVAMMNRKDELEEENGYCDIMAASFSDILSPVAERMDGENGALLP